MTSTIEYLEELLNSKDEMVKKLKEEIDKLNTVIRGTKTAWMAHREIKNVEDNLPLPRFELEWSPDSDLGWGYTTVEYRLIYRHFLGHSVVIPLGRTTIEGHTNIPPWNNPYDPERINLPLRDGAHSKHDSKQFGIPCYAILPEGTKKL